jgi:hypothetical protein
LQALDSAVGGSTDEEEVNAPCELTHSPKESFAVLAISEYTPIEVSTADESSYDVHARNASFKSLSRTWTGKDN